MNRDRILEIAEGLNFTNVLAHSRNVQCSCPLARWEHPKGSDSKPSMGILIDPQHPSVVNCFACGFKGTLQYLVERLQFHQPDVDLSGWIYKIAGWDEETLEAVVAEVGEYEDVRRKMEEKVFPEAYLDAYTGLAHPYITRRGLRIDPTLRAWEIGYDETQDRIVFPVRNYDGKLVGAVGRGVKKHSRPRYLNYWLFEKGLYLYGEHKLPKEPEPIVVVEGPTDALRVWQVAQDEGWKVNVVSLLGAEPTWKQVEKLVRFGSEIILFLDNDDPGWKGAEKVWSMAHERTLVTQVEYTFEGKPIAVGGDPDEDHEGRPWPEGWHRQMLNDRKLLA